LGAIARGTVTATGWIVALLSDYMIWLEDLDETIIQNPFDNAIDSCRSDRDIYGRIRFKCAL